MHYEYDIDLKVSANVETSTQYYLSKIYYTGRSLTSTSDCKYSVEFIRDSGTRKDQIINCRSGFKMLTRHRLDEVLVKYEDQIIRKYKFNYIEGMFHKTLLKNIVQYGEGGRNEFNRHEFKYHNKLTADYNDSTLNGFSEQTEWSNALNKKENLMVRFNQNIGTIGGNKSSGDAKNLYLGYSPEGSKAFSGGFKTAASNSTSNTLMMLMDINGDGLPDQVYKNGKYISYKANKYGESGKQEFASDKQDIRNIRKLSEDKNSSFTGGAQAHVGPVSLTGDISTGNVKGKYYFSDVNGDGLVDYIKNNTVYYNSIKNGKSVFSLTSPIPFGDPNSTGPDLGSVDLGLPSREEMLQTFPREDAIRMWRAPYQETGRIRIKGTPTLIKKPAKDPDEETYTTNDGVIVSIEDSKGNLLWSKKLAQSDTQDVSAYHDIIVENINAKDEIYFRVNSVYDGSFDVVKWDPEIYYIDSSNNQYDGGRTDENGFSEYRYKASEDFLINGEDSRLVCFEPGRIEITGDIDKSDLTSDDLVYEFYTKRYDYENKKETVTLVHTETVSWDYVGKYENVFPLRFNVEQGDAIVCRLTSKTPVDFRKIKSALKVRFLDAADEVIKNKKFKLPVSTKIFAVADDNPIVAFVPDEASKVTEADVNFGIGLYKDSSSNNYTLPANFNLNVTVSLKEENRLIRKKSATLNRNNRDLDLNFKYNFENGKKYYFVYSIESNLAYYNRHVFFKNPRINFDYNIPGQQQNVSKVAPFKVYRYKDKKDPFHGGFRNWYYARWKGEYTGNKYKYIDWEPLDKSRMVFPESKDDYEEKYKQFSGMLPPVVDDMHENAWAGNDIDCYITKDTMASTRLIEKYIMKEGESPVGGSTSVVPKYTKSITTSLGASAPIIGGSKAKTVSETKLDFFDFNGDRFPDIVAKGKINFTKQSGAKEEQFSKLDYHKDIGEVKYENRDRLSR
jgi:hypothetical protein